MPSRKSSRFTPTLEQFEDRLAPATFTVTNTSDAGAGSLRQAILDANANLGTDVVTFNIAASGVQSIRPGSALPAITDPVIIDGYTQPGASPNTLVSGGNAVLKIELDGILAGDAFGLHITAGHSKVRGLFPQPSGTVVLDEETPANSRIDATIDINLISTGVEERDTHLKSADFFDVAKYPVATFVSTSVTRSNAASPPAGSGRPYSAASSAFTNVSRVSNSSRMSRS